MGFSGQEEYKVENNPVCWIFTLVALTKYPDLDRTGGQLAALGDLSVGMNRPQGALRLRPGITLLPVPWESKSSVKSAFNYNHSVSLWRPIYSSHILFFFKCVDGTRSADVLRIAAFACREHFGKSKPGTFLECRNFLRPVFSVVIWTMSAFAALQRPLCTSNFDIFFLGFRQIACSSLPVFSLIPLLIA